MSIFGGIGSVVGADIIAYVKLSGADTFNRDLDKLNASAGSFGKMMNATMNAAVIGAGVAFVGASAAAIQFESSFAGVLKTTDGLTDSMGNINAEGVALSEEFRRLALEIPLSVNELNRIGELGGQLGIAKESLITFTSVIAQLGTTTDLSYEQGATAIAQFINVTKSVVPVGISVDEQLERIASTLVDLGNNSVATESQIMEFAQRLAGAGATIGLSQDEILAFGAALSSVGVNAEAGGTAFSKLFIDLKSAVELGGAKLQEFADAAHMSMGEFKTLFEQDASAAIVKFIEGLNETSRSGGSVIQVLNDLGITETRMRSAILLSVNAGDLLNETLNNGKTAYSENAAMAEEFAKRTATTEAQLTLLKNTVMDILIELGQNFLPIIRSVAETLAEHPTILSNILILLMGAGGIIAAVKLWTAAQTALDVLGATKLFSGLAAAIQANALQFTAVMGIIGAAIIAYQQISSAIAQAESAIKTLEEATARNVTVTGTANDNFRSMVAVLEELNQHGGNELVLFNGKVVTVSEAIGTIEPLLKKTAEEGEVFGAKVSVSFNAVDISSKNAKVSADDYKQTMEALKNTGIETSTQIQDQINKLESLRYAFINDSLVTAELSTKIADLRLKLDPTGQSLERMVLTTVDLNAKNALAKGYIGEVETSTLGQKTATDTANNSWAEYSSLIHEITGRMGSVGNAINIVVDSIISGGNPLVTALNLAAFAWDLFSGKEEKVVLSTDEVLNKMFGANSEIVNMIDNISDVTSAFGEYEIVQFYADRVDALAQKLTDLYNSGDASSRAINSLKNALADAVGQIEAFQNAAEYLEPTLASQANELFTALADAWEYYGGQIPSDVMMAFTALISENITRLQSQLAFLKEGTQAYQDTSAAMMDLQYQFYLMNGLTTGVVDWITNINAFRESLGQARFTAEQTAAFLESMGYSAQEATEAMIQLGYNGYEIAGALEAVGLSAQQAEASVQSLDDQEVYIQPVVNTYYAVASVNDLSARLAAITSTTYTANVNVVYTDPGLLSQHTGGMLYHSGGLVAHNGMMLGQYGTLREVPFTGLEGEYVLNPNIGRKFGEAALDAFNVSGNPAVLGGGESSMPNIEVIVEPTFQINEATEATTARLVDTKINKRIKETDVYKVKSRLF